MENSTQNIDPVKIDDAIQMLNEYIKESSIKPLVSLLEALRKDPDNKSLLVQVSDALKDLGVMKGAVLTYAPYVWIMLCEDPFED
ncbi:MAG: hypothetical protein ABIT70_09625 [Sulfuriferula sp.]|jgi:hypothetical protein